MIASKKTARPIPNASLGTVSRSHEMLRIHAAKHYHHRLFGTRVEFLKRPRIPSLLDARRVCFDALVDGELRCCSPALVVLVGVAFDHSHVP